jgi:hypothetical protein
MEDELINAPLSGGLRHNRISCQPLESIMPFVGIADRWRIGMLSNSESGKRYSVEAGGSNWPGESLSVPAVLKPKFNQVGGMSGKWLRILRDPEKIEHAS